MADKMLDTTPTIAPKDATADYGDDFAPTEPPKLEVELTAEELKAIGKEPAEEKVEEKVEEKAEEGVKAEDVPRNNKGEFIPRGRFNELNTKSKAKIAALESQLKSMAERLAPLDGVIPDVKTLETSLDAKSEEYGNLLADGKLTEAKLVLRDINKLNRQIGAIEAGALAGSHASEARHVDVLGQLVDMYKEAYPQFDDANKDLYNQDMVNFVAGLQGKFELAGDSPAEALRQAVEFTVAKFKLDADEPVEAAVEKATPAEDRKVAAVAKAIKASGAQPPKTGKVGIDSDKMGLSKIDVNALTQAEFARLPESALARLRGDLI